ncbi:MAG TPA: heparan-alpha-glucosaminide N-acetyltransferase domain-containing protein [Prolixibacteraceae bacterium]|nr:heparan-alpha-glucosaminide N-acetyltransferase domain-containing protein [Prolixibacteraceae bacterium]
MKTTQRYLALDVLRGMTVAVMILVNTPGSWSHIYAPLEHSKWHGCTPTDLIFPFFLFVVGVSMFFSFSKYGNSLNKESLLKIGKRTFLIFAIGLFLNSFPQWTTDYSSLRIMGVLQRIALAYGIGAVIVLAANRKYLPYIGAAILLLYWGLLYTLGGTDPFSLEGNVTIPFDTAILGTSHLYKGFGIPFDPEGLLSTIPAIVTVIIGYLVGSAVRETEKKLVPKRLIQFAVISIIAGLIWDQVFPINKPIWTSSYVLYAGGWACMVLALLIWIIDLKGYSRWTSFFVVFGMNPLFIFALSGLWARVFGRLVKIAGPDGELISGSAWLYKQVFLPLAGELNGSLLFAIFHVLIFWLIGYVLYKKKIFIKV